QDLPTAKIAEAKLFAAPIGKREVRRLGARQRTASGLGAERVETGLLIVDERHPEAFLEDGRGERTLGKRHAPDVLAGALRLDGPSRAPFELGRVDLEVRQDHSAAKSSSVALPELFPLSAGVARAWPMEQRGRSSSDERHRPR